MFGMLRTVRAIFGFVFALQIVNVISGVAALSTGVQNTGYAMAVVTIQVVVMVVAAAIFFGIRSGINALHNKKHGRPHPVLGHRRWAL